MNYVICAACLVNAAVLQFIFPIAVDGFGEARTAAQRRVAAGATLVCSVGPILLSVLAGLIFAKTF